jgi:hypothetical protein
VLGPGLGLGLAHALLGLSGCVGPSPIPSYPDQGSSDSGSGSGSTSLGMSGPLRTSESSESSTVADDTGTTASPDPTDVVFIIEPDGGGLHFECDLFEQDCRPGEKCVSWANDGGNSWNATKCVPVVGDPAGVGEPCHVERSGTSGIDDCGLEAMCFYVDPETLEGVCTAFCVGDESAPYCEDPNHHCLITGDGGLVLCLPRCNPLLQDCFEGLACLPFGNEWDCVPDVSGGMGVYGDPCEFLNECDPGLVCLGAAAVPVGEACEGAAGCCSEICDITDPAGDLQCAGAASGQLCQPWYEEGAAPRGYESVGACALLG